MINLFLCLLRHNFRFGRMCRLSIGTEHIDDIIADLEKGFAAAKAV